MEHWHHHHLHMEPFQGLFHRALHLGVNVPARRSVNEKHAPKWVTRLAHRKRHPNDVGVSTGRAMKHDGRVDGTQQRSTLQPSLPSP